MSWIRILLRIMGEFEPTAILVSRVRLGQGQDQGQGHDTRVRVWVRIRVRVLLGDLTRAPFLLVRS